ncbi:hypothetical protein [Rhizobium sp. SSA_523]|uniref:hypothetical protein n=1 Tax=Rhizobium sp. SSA_523 TaxID=2952477 RepID=UPI00209191AC|nr:hypothetical protein [Rhizobium sp. SSA_523]MCO5734850.1 hypothetical protein [Rhizobium sp. SSA_523]WKC24587.1 hypothetical protein QTJ18_11120 [Rhizobium sp. SSA_523]
MSGSDGNMKRIGAGRPIGANIAWARFAAGPLILLACSLMPIGDPAPAFAACPERPSCTGCGCKGGPGYRGPDGRCVGFKALDRICGRPPETRCTFENAPGTGANRDCALQPREAKKAR